MQFDLFDLNLLRALDVLLQEKNVTRAAERLNVTQQAMSGSLRRLREHFNDELLLRHGRKLEPTPLGIALSQPIREVMLHVERAMETKPSFDPALARRRFRIAMSDYASMTYLPYLMTGLAAAPGISCDIHLMDVNTPSEIESGKLDFCLLPGTFAKLIEKDPKDLRAQHLFREDWVCVVDRNNELVGDTISVEAYLSLPHNVAHFGDSGRSVVEASWAANQIKPNVVARTASFTSQISMVVGTSLVATTQRRLASIFEKALPIRILECPVAIDELREDLYWHARHDGDPAHRFMREVFASAAAMLSPIGKQPRSRAQRGR